MIFKLLCRIFNYSEPPIYELAKGSIKGHIYGAATTKAPIMRLCAHVSFNPFEAVPMVDFTTAEAACTFNTVIKPIATLKTRILFRKGIPSRKVRFSYTNSAFIVANTAMIAHPAECKPWLNQ